MKRIAYLLLLSLLVVGCSSEPKVKYVFYFIGDGMGVNEVIGTNLYNQANGQENVNFTSFPVVNFITTVSANSLVTDSSAAGTALATGVKINNSVVWTRTAIPPRTSRNGPMRPVSARASPPAWA